MLYFNSYEPHVQNPIPDGVMLVIVGSSYPGTPTNNYFYYLEKFKKRQRRRDLPNVIIIESIHLLSMCVYM